MSLSDVFFPGEDVFVERAFTKSPSQVGTPVSVTATIVLEDPTGTAVSPAPTATVNTVAGVATVTFSHQLPSTSALASGTWAFRIDTAGDLEGVFEDVFFVRESEVV